MCLLVVSLPVSVGLQSCVTDNEDCQAHESPVMAISFNIVTRGDDGEIATHTKGSITRAADIEGDIEGSGVENMLNIENNDLRYLIFDRNRQFLMDITPESTTTAIEDSNYKLYEVTAHIPKDEYFDMNIDGMVDFYILAIANYKDWGVDNFSIARNTTIEDFLSNTSGLVMTETPNNRVLLRQEDYEYYPGGKFFPMAGLQKFSIPGNMLKLSSTYHPYDISSNGREINMLRAIAKIEVIDKINVREVYDPAVDGIYFYGGNDDPAGQNSWLRIGKVEINGFMNQGSLIPSISQWINSDADETQQVKDPTIPSSAQYILPTDFPDGATDIQVTPGAQSNMFPDEYATQARTDKCPVFSGYVFEYSALAPQLNNISNTQKPYLSITTRGHTDAQGNQEAESMTYYIRLANYTNGAATSNDCLDRMLRNHIYRFVVTGISQDIQVYWTVCNMDNASADINFGEDTSGVTNPNKPE